MRFWSLSIAPRIILFLRKRTNYLFLSIFVFSPSIAFSDPPKFLYVFENGNRLIFDVEKGVILEKVNAINTSPFEILDPSFPRRFYATNVGSSWVNNVHNNGEIFHARVEHELKGGRYTVVNIGADLVLISQSGIRTELKIPLNQQRQYHQHTRNNGGLKSEILNWRVSPELTIEGQSYRGLFLPYPPESDLAPPTVGDLFLIRENGEFVLVPNQKLPPKFDEGISIRAEGESNEKKVIVGDSHPVPLAKFDELSKANQPAKGKKLIVDEDGVRRRPAEDIVNEHFVDYEEVIKRNGGAFEEPLDAKIIDSMRINLLRGQMKSSVLVGESGSGRTEYLNTFVASVKAGKYPEIPSTTRFIHVTDAALGAGSRFSGAFTSRSAALFELASSDPNVILIMDNQSLIRFTGAHQGDSTGFFDLAAPWMRSGSIRAIGSTTPEDLKSLFSGFSVGGAMTEIKISPIPNNQLVEALKSWSKKHGYPLLNEEVYVRILAISADYDARGTPLVKARRLTEMVYATAAFEGKEIGTLTEKYVDGPASRLYKIDRSAFDSEARINKLDQLIPSMNETVLGLQDLKEGLLRETTRVLFGTHDRSKPRILLLLAGPPGLGKTVLARAYARALGEKFVEIRMGDYTSGDTENFLNRLGSILTEDPHTVILFDEIDKASTAIHDLLLSATANKTIQMTESIDGSSTSNRKTTVEVMCSNASFLFTTNAGEDYIVKHPTGIKLNELKSAMTRVPGREGMGIKAPLLDRMLKIGVVHPPQTLEEFKKVLEFKLDSYLKTQEKAHGVSVSIENREEFLNEIAKKFFNKGENSYRDANDAIEDEAGFRLALHFKDNKGKEKSLSAKIKCLIDSAKSSN